jgi:magnesium and cobalt exporter, CNNM family
VPEEDYTTPGGYVFGVLGRLPVVGDRVTGGGAMFVVRAMEGRRIETLALERRLKPREAHSPRGTAAKSKENYREEQG